MSLSDGNVKKCREPLAHTVKINSIPFPEWLMSGWSRKTLAGLPWFMMHSQGNQEFETHCFKQKSLFLLDQQPESFFSRRLFLGPRNSDFISPCYQTCLIFKKCAFLFFKSTTDFLSLPLCRKASQVGAGFMSHCEQNAWLEAAPWMSRRQGGSVRGHTVVFICDSWEDAVSFCGMEPREGAGGKREGSGGCLPSRTTPLPGLWTWAGGLCGHRTVRVSSPEWQACLVKAVPMQGGCAGGRGAWDAPPADAKPQQRRRFSWAHVSQAPVPLPHFYVESILLVVKQQEHGVGWGLFRVGCSGVL